tara:strand:+ start:992 stop:1243 length:252 start_codon:yes stop_codon:yes gene_type:complete
MDYSELHHLYMENELLITELNHLKDHIKRVSPYKNYLIEMLNYCESEEYEETYGVEPYEIETKDLKDSGYKTLRILIEFFENY